MIKLVMTELLSAKHEQEVLLLPLPLQRTLIKKKRRAIMSFQGVNTRFCVKPLTSLSYRKVCTFLTMHGQLTSLCPSSSSTKNQHCHQLQHLPYPAMGKRRPRVAQHSIWHHHAFPSTPSSRCRLLQTRQTARRLQSCISSFQDQLRILYSANLPRTVHATLSHAPAPSATAIGPPLIHQHPVDAILRTLKLASQ